VAGMTLALFWKRRDPGGQMPATTPEAAR
jgi:hypothetical protein